MREGPPMRAPRLDLLIATRIPWIRKHQYDDDESTRLRSGVLGASGAGGSRGVEPSLELDQERRDPVIPAPVRRLHPARAQHVDLVARTCEADVEEPLALTQHRRSFIAPREDS